MLCENYINKIKSEYIIGDRLLLENSCKRKEDGRIIQITDCFVVVQFKHWKECFNWFEIYNRFGAYTKK